MSAPRGTGNSEADTAVDTAGLRQGHAGANSHLVVVGSGIAGLYSALLAAEAGTRVTLVTKGELAQSNTHFAQGGICAVLGPQEAAPGDTVAAHIADTLKAGAGQCNPDAVRILCTEAGGDIAALERFGVAFDRDPATGRRSLGLEGAHSAARILHAGGDATGAAIADGLIRAVRDAAKLGTLRILEHAFVRDLLHDAGRVTGVSLLTAAGGQRRLEADAVLLASGGAGQLFDFTTNPVVATADGLAAAWRAGAVVTDLEYFQFHPTALAMGENFLISEAVRGAGAVLRDSRGENFMRHHPEGDLAPRDVVSRSIAAHLDSLRGNPARTMEARAANAATVFLDATGVEAVHGSGYLARRFPTIDAETGALGFDWRTEWLPVTPAAHYWMGGVATDLSARTSLPGLYAAGEVACTGVHGANRLASNSLLEGLVFGRRAVESFTAGRGEPWPTGAGTGAHEGTGGASPLKLGTGAGNATGSGNGSATGTGPAQDLDHGPGLNPGHDGRGGIPAAAGNRQALQHLMGAKAGVVRNAGQLAEAAAQLASWRSQAQAQACTTAAGRADRPTNGAAATGVGTAADGNSFAAAEWENLLLAASLLVHAAQARMNSVGAHWRSDFPQPPREGPGNRAVPADPSCAANDPADTVPSTASATAATPANPVPTAGATRSSLAWVAAAAAAASAHVSTGPTELESETV